MNEIEKIKYHIQLISETIDHQIHPIPYLVISEDWGKEDLSAAHDIFEKFDAKLERGETVNWYEFEEDFKKRFNMSYQALKSVVLAFFRNGQWDSVCRTYAAEHHCVEFSEISRNQNYSSSLEEQIASVLIRSNIIYSKEDEVRLRNGTSFRVDFLLSLPQRKIAVEAKSSISVETALPKLEVIAETIVSSKIADELWVVTDSPVTSPLSSSKGINILSVDELERKLIDALS